MDASIAQLIQDCWDRVSQSEMKFKLSYAPQTLTATPAPAVLQPEILSQDLVSLGISQGLWGPRPLGLCLCWPACACSVCIFFFSFCVPVPCVSDPWKERPNFNQIMARSQAHCTEGGGQTQQREAEEATWREGERHFVIVSASVHDAMCSIEVFLLASYVRATSSLLSKKVRTTFMFLGVSSGWRTQLPFGREL